MVHMHKWYVVIRGTEPGVYPTWIEAGPKTKGIPGGPIHQAFFSKEEADRAFKAAKARGEVEAFPVESPIKNRKTKSKSNNPPSSPTDTDVSLLRTPLSIKREVDSAGLQTSLSPPVHSQLRRTLRDSTHSFSTSSSPPTHVTQRDRVYAPLYVDDSPPQTPVAPPSPHPTWTSSSSRAYPDPNEFSPFMGIGQKETPPRQAPSSIRRDSSPPPSSSGSDSESSPEQPQTPPRSVAPLARTPTRSFKLGVRYQSLNDLAEAESIDSRVWLPKQRGGNANHAKSQASTRPSSPVKAKGCPTPSPYETAPSSPFVRVDRGRPSKLTPTWSLPALPSCDMESILSGSPSRRNHFRADQSGSGKGKGVKEDGVSVHGQQSAVASVASPGRSHFQLVRRDGGHEENAIKVHCPPNCAHEACYRPQYVDACVSPIIITSHIQAVALPAKNRSKSRSGSDEDIPSTPRLAGYSSASHVSHRGLAPEADVRSPIGRGTMVPLSIAEMGRARWRYASRVRRLAVLTSFLFLSDLACFSVVVVATVLTPIFWALQNTIWPTVSSSTSH